MTRGQARQHTLPRIVGRFLAGHHLDGVRRSDATFWRDGTAGDAGSWFGSGRESWWVLAAGWKRAGLRLAVLAILVGLWRWRTGTVWVLALVGGPVAGLLAWHAVAAARLRRHTREVHRPLSAALAPYLGVPPRAVESALDVDPGFDDAGSGEHVAALELPDHWAASQDQRAMVEQVVGARFGMELRYQWQTAKYPMLLNITRAPVPPASVPFAEVRRLVEACSREQMFLGLDSDHKPHHWDTSAEDPHLAVHGGSRRGKTSLFLFLAAQELRKGAGLTWINPKITGHEPIAGLPKVRVCNDPRDIDAMWQGVRDLADLVQDRYEELAADPTTEFDRELLIIDELWQFSAQTAAHWRKVRERGEPARCPWWDEYLGPVVWMGAQCRVHVIVGGQRLDYAILGGLLGSFGVRMLAGYQAIDFKRLVGTTPVLRSQKPRGRFLLSEGGDLTWLQLVRADVDGDWSALRDFAAGRDHAPAKVLADQGATTRTGTPDAAGLIVGVAAAARHLGMRFDAFEKARKRRPVPGETRTADDRPAWPPEALAAWREARPSVRLAARDGERAS